VKEHHNVNREIASLYEAMKIRARGALRAEYRPDRVQTTALVHEAYLRMGTCRPIEVSTEHFLNTASKVMRQVLVDEARARATQKRGGGMVRGDVVDLPASRAMPVEQVIALHDALEHYARREPTKAKLVELRTFGGFTLEEACNVIGVSKATAKRYWAVAKLELMELLEAQSVES